ncbi:MAG TPA: hypothetical protein VN848_06945 [Gemmatimonadales bacterium]|nr:hypothetical protein [Gemmatimonadales bacterium]
MAAPLVYRSGDDIRTGDRVLLHGEPGHVELVLDGEHNPRDWPAKEYGRGIMIAEPKVFGRLFLAERDLEDYEDLEFVSRSTSPE